MKRRCSPRQRRDAARRRRWLREAAEQERRRQAELAEQQAELAEQWRAAVAEQEELEPLREEIAASRRRRATAADLLAWEHGAHAVPILARGGCRGVAVIGAGWRVVGPLHTVQAELAQRAAGEVPAREGRPGSSPAGQDRRCR